MLVVKLIASRPVRVLKKEGSDFPDILRAKYFLAMNREK